MQPVDAEHKPVMVDGVIQLLACRRGGSYVDGTTGGGGYTRAMLEASSPDGRVLAIDWDGETLDAVRTKLAAYGERVLCKQANFADLPLVLAACGWPPVDGVALDLGISSLQLDSGARGFSLLRDGPLDMRMDRTMTVTAADLVNELPEVDLRRIIRELGEDRWAGRIARAIAVERRAGRLGGTLELAELIARTVPKTPDSLRIHPATRTFLALRLAVNRELESLTRFLAQVLEVLKAGGRLCIVAFHSLEDRLVKQHFQRWARHCRCPAEVLRCRCSGKPLVRLLTRKALRPGVEEIALNPRARSARLRALEKC